MNYRSKSDINPSNVIIYQAIYKKTINDQASTDIPTDQQRYRVTLSNCAKPIDGERHLTLMLGAVAVRTIQTGESCGASNGWLITLAEGTYFVNLCVYDSKNSVISSNCGAIQALTVAGDMHWEFTSLNSITITNK